MPQSDRGLNKSWVDFDGLSQAERDVLAERQRQITGEGFKFERDDKYENGELERAGAAYALVKCRPQRWYINDIWAFHFSWWRPRTHRENLVKGAALLIAAIEKLDRAAGGGQ